MDIDLIMSLLVALKNKDTDSACAALRWYSSDEMQDYMFDNLLEAYGCEFMSKRVECEHSGDFILRADYDNPLKCAWEDEL